MSLSSASRCAVHPEVAAVEICSRCGAFTCGACLEFSEADTPLPFCAPCYQREFGQKASGQAVAALAIAIAGLSFCWPAGAVAWFLAERELSAIARGEASPRGRNLAKGARIIGLLELGLTVLAVLALGVAGAVGYFSAKG